MSRASSAVAELSPRAVARRPAPAPDLATPLTKPGNVLVKELFDRALALVALLALFPVILAIGVLIKLTSRGPAIYRRRVVGRNGVEFDAFKFRTMAHGSEWVLENDPGLKEAFLVNYKLLRDPRVTRVGATLRRYSLDELPQLFNVLRGEMWLIGPRMVSPAELERYGSAQTKLLTIKPGITGLWQVSGRQTVSYERRVQLDMHYIDNWSVRMDVRILLRTVGVVLSTKGAY